MESGSKSERPEKKAESAANSSGERKNKFATSSGIELERLYTHEGVGGLLGKEWPLTI